MSRWPVCRVLTVLGLLSLLSFSALAAREEEIGRAHV